MSSAQVGTALQRAIRKATHLAGLDADVLSTFVFRVWSSAAGAVSIALIPAFLSGVEQGYYYTFASLLALQIFFELGMSQVILQLVSHDFAHLRPSAEGGPPLDPERMDRLLSLTHRLRRWYAVAATGFVAIVSVGGAFFLGSHPSLAPTSWLGPWLALTLATGVNLYLSAKLAVREGCGEIASVARLRFRQSLLGYVAMWLVLTWGGGLWAAVMVPAIAAAYTAWWLHAAGQVLGQARSVPDDGASSVQWRRDVFPLQWRMALSWIAGYFIFQLLTPLAFARQGPVEAGRLGITMAVFNAVLAAGMSWVGAKFPAMAIHLSRRERPQANALFTSLARRAVAFTAAASVLVVLALLVLGNVAPTIAQRFTSVPVALCIAVVTLSNTFIFAAAAYLRAHKEEPMLWVSLVAGLATFLAVMGGSALGVLPMMVSYMLVTVFVPLPWTWLLFRRYFRRVDP